MDNSTSILLLYIVALIVIVFILYTMLKKPQTIQIYNEIPPPQKIDTHWWGYGWRPWWRRYAGVPGFKSLPPKPVTLKSK